MAVIDIGGYSLKALNKNKTFDFVLPCNCVCGTFSLPSIDEDAFSYVLKQLKKEARINDCDIILPDQWARQLFIKITSDEPQQNPGADYVIWRAKEQIREEVYSGAKICAHITGIETGEDKKQHIDAYLCLVKYEILNRVIDLFSSCSINVRSIELSSHAIYNYLLLEPEIPLNFALINIGYEVCTIYFFVSGHPVYVRIIETAGKHFESELNPAAKFKNSVLSGSETDATAEIERYKSEIKRKKDNSAALMALKIFPSGAKIEELEVYETRKSPMRDNFLKEIHLTFEFFASKFPGSKTERVYLSGGMCKFGGLDFFLSNFLSIETRYATQTADIQNLALRAPKEF